MSEAPLPALPDVDIGVASDSETEIDPPCRVIVHNDDVTPMDFVVEVLVGVFDLAVGSATAIMLEAHHNGRAHVITLGREEAKHRVGQAHQLSRAAGYPLSFTIEPEQI